MCVINAVLMNTFNNTVMNMPILHVPHMGRASDADFIVLEGMGRGIETNLRARFSCDALRVGMIKHPEVAAALGGRMYDCVVRFERGASGGGG